MGLYSEYNRMIGWGTWWWHKWGETEWRRTTEHAWRWTEGRRTASKWRSNHAVHWWHLLQWRLVLLLVLLWRWRWRARATCCLRLLLLLLLVLFMWNWRALIVSCFRVVGSLTVGRHRVCFFVIFFLFETQQVTKTNYVSYTVF